MTATTPPPEITGPKRRETPVAIKEARANWAWARRAEGWPLKRIATALGISLTSTHALCAAGAPRRQSALSSRTIHRAAGVKIGHCGVAFDKMPPEVREDLAMTAARQRKTIAEVLVESYAATLAK